MIPKILEYEDGIIKITPQAFAIPELKKIIDKYKKAPEAYLMYVYASTQPDSPYINIPLEERDESIIYDINATMGEFLYTDPLLETAIEKLKSLYASPIVLMAAQMDEELHNLRKYLKVTPFGPENYKDRMSMMKDIDKIATSYNKIKDLANKEIAVATKGDHEIGGY